MIEQRQKVTEDSKLLFLLPQQDEELFRKISNRVKSTTETEEPVLISKRVPQLDEYGDQMRYEITRAEENEDGETVQVGTGQYLKVWVTEEVQEEDEEGNLLYWETIIEEESYLQPLPPLEITEDDERWTEDLKPSYELIEIPDPPQPPAPPVILTPDQQKISVLEKDLSETKQDAADNNLQIITLWETLIDAGVL